MDEAERAGLLVRPAACEMCGHRAARRRPAGHHEDYARPLDVVWLCTPCHSQVHGPGLVVYVERLRAALAAAEPLLARDLERQGA